MQALGCFVPDLPQATASCNETSHDVVHDAGVEEGADWKSRLYLPKMNLIWDWTNPDLHVS